MVKQDSGFRFRLRKAFKFQTSRGVCQDPESGFFASRTLGSKATDRGFGSATREILLSVSGFLKKIGTKFYRRKTCPWRDLRLLTRTVFWRSPPSTSLYSASSFFSETHSSFIPRRNLSERDWCRYIPCQLSTAPSWHHLKNKNKTVLQVRTVYPGFRVWIFHPGSKLKKTPDTESCLDLDQKIVTKLSVLFSIPTWIRNNENKIKDEDKWGGGREREMESESAREKKTENIKSISEDNLLPGWDARTSPVIRLKPRCGVLVHTVSSEQNNCVKKEIRIRHVYPGSRWKTNENLIIFF